MKQRRTQPEYRAGGKDEEVCYRRRWPYAEICREDYRNRNDEKEGKRAIDTAAYAA